MDEVGKVRSFKKLNLFFQLGLELQRGMQVLRLRIQPGLWCRWGQLFQPLLRRLHQRGRWQLHGLQLHRRRDRDSGKIFFQIFVESKFLKLLPIYARCTRHIFQRFDSFYTYRVSWVPQRGNSKFKSSECCEGPLRQQVRSNVRTFHHRLLQHLLHVHDVDAECDRNASGS